MKVLVYQILIAAVMIFLVVNLYVTECKREKHKVNVDYPAISCRKHTASILRFGGVGDGKTLNTKAISHLRRYASKGGAQLIVPAGKWLTGSFNLTSHFTLYLEKGAVLLASQDEADWPQLTVLPSYGRGRDAPDGRYSSLIFGTNLTDVVITGNNGKGGALWSELRAWARGKFLNFFCNSILLY